MCQFNKTVIKRYGTTKQKNKTKIPGTVGTSYILSPLPGANFTYWFIECIAVLETTCAAA